MKIRQKTFWHLVVALFGILSVFGQQANAAVTCRPSTAFPPLTIVPNVTVSSSTAGEDMDVGSTIWATQMGYSSQTIGIYCDGAFNVTMAMKPTNLPSGSPTTMTTLYGSVPVFPTNVPGVGVVIWKNGNEGRKIFLGTSLISTTDPISLDRAGDNGLGPHVKYFGVALVKTGAIASGAVVNASSFPHWAWVVPPQSGYGGLPISLLNVSFTGSSRFVTQTCTTPANTIVNLGKYSINDATFSGVGSTTKWIDSSIVLQNCPKFNGFYGYHGYQTIDGSNTPTGGFRTANTFTISVVPANPVSGKVIAIDTGADAAKGVGIQLGYTPDDINAAATAPTTVWSDGDTWNLTPPVEGGTVKIPLAARYYQTEKILAPGMANAEAVVNIFYK
ncbi:fimbrial protein [Dryocola clanedunensis]|uniref:fimbrial protein n=1 Tax=Cedecea sulfonylureivorans TaxID=3051154 RepID=UPI001926F695|nr:fimbrial protein [Cedecea sulfonylureivorans]